MYKQMEEDTNGQTDRVTMSPVELLIATTNLLCKRTCLKAKTFGFGGQSMLKIDYLDITFRNILNL